MVTDPGKASELLKRRNELIPKKLKFLTRKRKLLKWILKAGLYERVKGHVAT
jgi:hypothetical protein